MSHAVPLVLSFYLGVFAGIFVIGLVNINRIEEDDDEHQKH